VQLAEDVCIGTVVATRSVLYPAAVGGDIGCGVASLRYAADAAVLDDARTAAVILDDLRRSVLGPRGGGLARSRLVRPSDSGRATR
jgi:RNA-splicing ligase RtcB